MLSHMDSNTSSSGSTGDGGNSLDLDHLARLPSFVDDPGEDEEDQQQHQYHKSRGGNMRAFRLLALGTTDTSKAIRCELCKYMSPSADPLYPGHEREWAYYNKKTGLPEGVVCFYSAITHRCRYRAWTREELSNELNPDEKQEEFNTIEAAVISQKRKGVLELDMSGLPVPIIVVTNKTESSVIFKRPKEIFVTEAAFKRRCGMTFKEAGMSSMVEEKEVQAGIWATGYAEVVGEKDVYEIERSWAKKSASETMVDDGRPQIDDGQAAANFNQITKKVNKANSTKLITADAVAAMVKAAKVKAGAASAESSLAPSGGAAGGSNAAGNIDGPACKDEDDSEEGAQEEGEVAEHALEAALAVLGSSARGAPKKGGGGGKKRECGKGGKEEAPDSAKKRARSSGSLTFAKEKAEKELRELLEKFWKQTIGTGPLANKKKALAKAHEKLHDDVQGHDDITRKE